MPETGRIIVPLDGSTVGECAIPVAALLARAYGSAVDFVHAVDYAAAAGEPQADAGAQFRSYAEGLAASAGIERWEAELRVGLPAPTILAAAEGAAFIVIGSRGRGGVQRPYIGSVSDKVLRAARVPVLFVPADGHGDLASSSTIVIGLDGSPSAEEGLALGREVAKRLAKRPTLVEAWGSPAAGGIGFQLPGVQVAGVSREDAEAYLASVREGDEATRAQQGSAADALAGVADEVGAALIVVASTGKGPTRRLMLGSTTDRLIHSTRCPVLVMPTGTDAAWMEYERGLPV